MKNETLLPPDRWDKVYSVLDFGVELAQMFWLGLIWLSWQLLKIFFVMLALLILFAIFYTHPSLLIFVAIAIVVLIGISQSTK